MKYYCTHSQIEISLFLVSISIAIEQQCYYNWRRRQGNNICWSLHRQQTHRRRRRLSSLPWHMQQRYRIETTDRQRPAFGTYSNRRRIFTVNFTSWSTAFVVQVVFLVGLLFVELSLFVFAALLLISMISYQIYAFLTNIFLQ